MIWQREYFDLISQERPLQMKLLRGAGGLQLGSVNPAPLPPVPSRTLQAFQEGMEGPTVLLEGMENVCTYATCYVCRRGGFWADLQSRRRGVGEAGEKKGWGRADWD